MKTVPLAYSVIDAADAIGCSRTHIDRLIRSGRLRAKSTEVDADGNPSGKRLILATDLAAYLESLAEA